jgi:hypothetical protein
MKNGLILFMVVGVCVIQAQAFYTDAVGGSGGNTVQAGDSNPDAWWNTSTEPDGIWGLRSGFANEGTIFESSGTGSGIEDSMAVMTTVSGLTAGQLYRVEVVYWSSESQNWAVNAGFDLDSMTLFDRLGDGAVAGTWTDIQEGDRLELLGTVGIVEADVNGQIKVYVDDKPSSASQGGWYDRSWYDGINVTAVPEPTTCVLLVAGGILGLRRRH